MWCVVWWDGFLLCLLCSWFLGLNVPGHRSNVTWKIWLYLWEVGAQQKEIVWELWENTSTLREKHITKSAKKNHNFPCFFFRDFTSNYCGVWQKCQVSFQFSPMKRRFFPLCILYCPWKQWVFPRVKTISHVSSKISHKRSSIFHKHKSNLCWQSEPKVRNNKLIFVSSLLTFLLQTSQNGKGKAQNNEIICTPNWVENAKIVCVWQ